jgi:hypothetical protein
MQVHWAFVSTKKMMVSSLSKSIQIKSYANLCEVEYVLQR